MTPKQKAEELVDKYRILLQDTDTEVGEEILCTLVAKSCAKIAVDEIIKEVGKLNIEILHTEWGDKLAEINAEIRTNHTFFVIYWQQVKTEINKI